MKTKLLTIAGLFFLTSVAALAQKPNSQEKITAETREMAVKLGLNEFGYIQLKNLNQEKHNQLLAITNNYSYDTALRDSKLAELNRIHEIRVRDFLSNKQLEAYIALNVKQNAAIALENENR